MYLQEFETGLHILPQLHPTLTPELIEEWKILTNDSYWLTHPMTPARNEQLKQILQNLQGSVMSDLK